MEYENELYHHGIRGMKWGIRRYQNKDGSLTKAGKKRYEAELKAMSEKERALKKSIVNKKKFDKLNAKKRELEALENELKGKTKPTAPRQKSVAEMTLEELRAETDRMNAEKNFYEARKNLAAANPPKVSAGKKFAMDLMNDVVAPAAKKAGQAYLEKVMKDMAGANKKQTGDSLDDLLKPYRNMSDDLKREIERAAGIKKNISKLRGGGGGD